MAASTAGRERKGRRTVPLPRAVADRYCGGMSREIRIEISDELYEQLQQAAAERRLPPEAYAGQVLNADLTRTRFREGARAFVAEHADGFAERFGGPARSSADAA
jgi:predicted transcriptional regulator